MHQVLDEEGKRGVAIFQKCIQPYRATGKTQASAYYKIEGSDTKTDLTINARGFTEVMQTGSKPSKKKPSPEMIEELKPWAQVRGIAPEAVYGIAVKLLRDGQKVHRNVYSDQMSKFADEVADRVNDLFAGYAIDKIVNAFK